MSVLPMSAGIMIRKSSLTVTLSTFEWMQVLPSWKKCMGCISSAICNLM